MLTRTESAIIAILSDGNRHGIKEILEKAFDPYTESRTVHVHMNNIRNKLPPDETVVSEFNKGFFYRHVRLLRPGSKK